MCNKMSDVRLSNASPTLERVDARQPDNAKPPVCRNLFGTPGHREGLQSYFRAAMQEEERAFEESWDFDPVTNTPRNPPRNFEWEETSNAPEFYSRQPHQRQRSGADLHGGNDQQDAEERNERRSDPRPARHGSRKRPAKRSGGCSSECQSKRSHTDDDDDEEQPGRPTSQSVTSVELTPNKPDNGTLLQ